MCVKSYSTVWHGYRHGWVVAAAGLFDPGLWILLLYTQTPGCLDLLGCGYWLLVADRWNCVHNGVDYIVV